MKKLTALITLLLLFTLSGLRAQKFEGLAETPPMGWNSWNKFACNIDENLIRTIADAMVETGLRDAGYIYLNLDDCWHGERDSLGFIQPDPAKFPSGMKALADYVHSKGLKIGIYSDAGRKTCGGRPGSFGHEYQDALQYAKWGIDYLKYDWCETEDINPVGAYNLMRDAIHAAGRPILFSMCEWGTSKPWLWAKDTGHMWRTTGDIYNCFDCIDQHPGWAAFGVLQILDMQNGLRQYAGPGHWNDPDMLEVGNGQSVNQDRAHFTMWSMLAAPLILGNDIRNMTQETKDILMNAEVIAVNQDKLGIQGFRHLVEDGLEIWFKPLENDDWAFTVLNRTTEPKSYTINWEKLDLYDDVAKRFTNFDSNVYSIRNLWTKQNEGDTRKVKEVTVPGHDVVLYRLSKKK
ncbi:glycoside hydrolase family 27 protein [Bacteroides sp. 51]|uniref:glycoside hydrolase family 27 protein n=1 Tax=Bacteroides sp. 51 TaxID=2302938 RepID=UPI0013D02D95|nr:glycoside hydrolase family 27 protein [Bacteroides sp. 51]NDV83167.1 glycoside hydrolase family 27 protein [Bacteroides sp. 51]